MAQPVIPGPRTWNVDASLFKVVRISERMNARLTSKGFPSLQNSYNSPRQTQLSLRLQW